MTFQINNLTQEQVNDSLRRISNLVAELGNGVKANEQAIRAIKPQEIGKSLQMQLDDYANAIFSEISAAHDVATRSYTGAFSALQNAATAQETADGKIRCFYQPDAPTGMVAGDVGDLWFDTDDDNKIYRWSGTAWQEARDSGIADAISSAQTAQTTADGKAYVHYQNGAPAGKTAGDAGDLWVDTDDDNKVYVWSGSAWVLAQDWVTANENALDALGRLEIIASDGYLSKGEKPLVSREWQSIYSEHSDIEAKADAVGVSKTAYVAAYTALSALLTNLDPGYAWDDVTRDTVIVASTWKSTWATYYSERTKIQNAIAAKLKETTDTLAALLDEFGNDDVLSKVEKPGVITAYREVLDDYPILSSRASAAGLVFSDYTNAYTALVSYMEQITPAYDNTSVDSTLPSPPAGSPAEYDTPGEWWQKHWRDYNRAYTNLLTKLAGSPPPTISGIVSSNYADLSNIASSAPTIDGVVRSAGNTFMLVGQTTVAQDGLYTLAVQGTQGAAENKAPSSHTTSGTVTNPASAYDMSGGAPVLTTYATMSANGGGSVELVMSGFSGTWSSGQLNVVLNVTAALTPSGGATSAVIVYYSTDGGGTWSMAQSFGAAENGQHTVQVDLSGVTPGQLRVKIVGFSRRVRIWDTDLQEYVYETASVEALARAAYVYLGASVAERWYLTRSGDVLDGSVWYSAYGTSYGDKTYRASVASNGDITLTQVSNYGSIASWGSIQGTLDDQADLKSALDGKASATHNHDSAYAAIGHNHNGVYSLYGHNHDGAYALYGHNHDGVYAASGHNHSGVYQPIDADLTALAALTGTGAPVRSSDGSWTLQTGFTPVAHNHGVGDLYVYGYDGPVAVVGIDATGWGAMLTAAQARTAIGAAPATPVTYTLSTNIANSGYVRLGRVPIGSSKKGCTVRVRGVKDSSGTETDTLVTVTAAHDADTPNAAYFALSVLASHSTNSDTTADPGYVLRYFRVGSSTADGYVYLDVEIRKDPTVTVETTPIESGDWEWFSGSTTTNVSGYTLVRTATVVAYGGFSATNLTANAASSATYASGLFSGQSLSDNNNKTGKWEYIGNIVIEYNASYLGGRCFNGEVKLKELSASKDAADLEEVTLHILAQMDAFASSTAFNTAVPNMVVEFEGDTALTGNDFAVLVYSTSTSQKVIRIYVKLKDANTHYAYSAVVKYGHSYTSTLASTTNYCSFNSASSQAVVTTLPTPAQGSVVYATARKVQIAQLPVGTGSNEVASGNHTHTFNVDGLGAGGASAGYSLFATSGTTYGWAETPYPFSVTCSPKPGASQKLLIYVAERPFKVKSTGHKGKCYTNPTTSSAVITLKKNGTSFGTLTFSTAGAFSESVTETSFAADDIFTMEAPSSQNSTFADFGVTVKAVLA